MRTGIAAALRMLWVKHCGFDSHLGYMRTDIIDRKLEIEKWVQENCSNAEIAKRLSCKVDTLKAYYVKLGITYKGNQGAKGHKQSPYRLTIEDYIKSNASNSAKRLRLIESRIKENKCECCGLSEWMGKPIPLELHHKDFNHYNNSLDNLQILCSNCHMQAHNYCNTKRRDKED